MLTELAEAARVLDDYRPDLGEKLRAETRLADVLRDMRDEVGPDEPQLAQRPSWPRP